MPDISRPQLALSELALLHADFNQRAVVSANQSDWIDTDNPGISIRSLEVAVPDSQRLTLMVRFKPGASCTIEHQIENEEILVLDGSLDIGQDTGNAGCYIRNPQSSELLHHSKDGCLLFVKFGAFDSNDSSRRIIDTQTEENWLPGPVEGTEVRALHMHDTRSVLMIRWLDQAAFKPALDPQGEEVFIVRGQLNDADGAYTQHHWIRNPVPAWQSWCGQAGTLVYYKNGHFPAPTAGDRTLPVTAI